jgi:6-phosphogluconolactonase (cycloisomerase 2 family)
MTFSKIGRVLSALVASAALGLGMTACGGGTIGFMWVLGTTNSSQATAAGEIVGFKIDDYTGNLTVMEHSPFSSGGSNPQMIAVKPGGRFVYVINSGVNQVGVPNSAGYVAPQGNSISQFSVGGDGVLTFQQNFFSQGGTPIYLAFDGTGNFLYVLDKYSPNYGTIQNGVPDLNGAITAFSVASDTGRLTLVQNLTVLNSNNTPTNFFEVGPNPVMSRIGSGSCLYTLSPQEIYPYVISSATGQLTPTTTGPQLFPTATSLTSINTSQGTSAGSYTYLTDGGSNQIYSLQAGSATCTLSPVPGSQQTNVAADQTPVNSITSNNGKFLYVINQTSTGGNQTPTQSSISAFTIDSSGRIQTLSDGTNNPYATGSGPVCVVEDPSNQYLYTSNHVDGTVTGKLLDQNRGYLADLSRGSTFPGPMNATCLAVSGNL